ncbi:MAG: radical SAM protein [Myxococcales bacterium]|nr:radical SAM protein [Myxococcales bacterium]
MNDIQPDSLQLAMLDAYRRADRPMVAQLDVTYRCDLNCQHCYLDDRTTWPELTTGEWHNVVEQLAQLGVIKLTWSGGDPFMRADLLQLVQHAGTLGFSSTLRTHAMAVNPQVALQFRNAGVELARVSLYSLRPEIHDPFTRGAGSLAKTLFGIDALVAAGIEVKVDVFVTAEMIEEIPEIAKYFIQRGATAGFANKVHRDHLARTDLDRLELTSDQRVRAQQLTWQSAANNPNGPGDIHGRLEQGSCGAGRQSLYISPDGGVWPCVMFPMELGHLKRESLAVVWQTSPQRQQILSFSNADRTACHSCAGSGTCFFCMGEAFKTKGDFRTPPAHVHGRTRDWMHGYEAAHGQTWTADQWATVPEGGERPARPERFVFPIYRASKGRGTRVGDGSQP